MKIRKSADAGVARCALEVSRLSVLLVAACTALTWLLAPLATAYAQAATIPLHIAAQGQLSLVGLIAQGVSGQGAEPLVLLQLRNNSSNDLTLNVEAGTVLNPPGGRTDLPSLVFTGLTAPATSPDNRICGLIDYESASAYFTVPAYKTLDTCFFGYMLQTPNSVAWPNLRMQVIAEGQDGYSIAQDLAPERVRNVLASAVELKAVGSETFNTTQYAVWAAGNPHLDSAALNGFFDVSHSYDESRAAEILAQAGVSTDTPTEPTVEQGATAGPTITVGSEAKTEVSSNQLDTTLLIIIGVLALALVGVLAFTLGKRQQGGQPNSHEQGRGRATAHNSQSVQAPPREGITDLERERALAKLDQHASGQGMGVADPDSDPTTGPWNNSPSQQPGLSNSAQPQPLPFVPPGLLGGLQTGQGPARPPQPGQAQAPYGGQSQPPYQGYPQNQNPMAPGYQVGQAPPANQRQPGGSPGRQNAAQGQPQRPVPSPQQGRQDGPEDSGGFVSYDYTPVPGNTSGLSESSIADEIQDTHLLRSSSDADLVPPTADSSDLPYLDGIDGTLLGFLEYLERGRTILSRAKLEQVEVRQGSVSAPHALLVLNKGVLSVTDLHSGNGTFVDGVRVQPGPDINVQIDPGQVLRLGEVDIHYDAASQSLSWNTHPNGRTVRQKLKDTNRWLLGRRSLPFLVLKDDAISAPHAYIDVSRGYELRPLKNRNKIYVDGQEIAGNIAIKAGSTIVLGDSTLRLRINLDHLPSKFGLYQVLNKINDGGMADVLLVTHEGSTEQMALKVPKQVIWAQPGANEFRQRWWQEIQVLRDISKDAPASANIVHYIDHDSDRHAGGIPYMVMTYVDGCSLYKVSRALGQSTPLAVGDAYDVARALAEALIYLENCGVAHCDVKPGNMLFDRQGRLFLVDFGLAVRFEETAPRMGTRIYMAPEVPTGVKASPKIDLYSFGAVLHLMLTGRKIQANSEPRMDHRGNTPISDIDEMHITQVSHAQGTVIEAQLEQLNKEVQEMVAACLAQDPQDRPNSAREVLEVLNRQPEQGNLAELVRTATVGAPSPASTV
ncbi:MAG: protein kinase [Chloroflexota bacterium]|nr:protein kinase [Chloroflexota bacterium]